MLIEIQANWSRSGSQPDLWATPSADGLLVSLKLKHFQLSATPCPPLPVPDTLLAEDKEESFDTFLTLKLGDSKDLRAA